MSTSEMTTTARNYREIMAEIKTLEEQADLHSRGEQHAAHKAAPIERTSEAALLLRLPSTHPSTP